MVALLVSFVLGAAFVLAGASKLAAGAGWPAAARAMGAPSAVVPFVPWFELAVGAAVVVRVGEPLPELMAVVLLVAFSALIALRLSRGEHPVCACFGAWSARPLGPGHLVRNAVLLAVAVAAVVT